MSKVLVIGDVMIDKHVRGEVKRISPEAPVPIINVIGEPEESIGAAGYIAAQISEAGHEVSVAFKHGDDGLQEMIWNQYDVTPYPLNESGRKKTTTKTRVWTGDQQICRIDDEDTMKPVGIRENKRIDFLINLVSENNYDCVVFSDYNKGTLTDCIIQQVADLCKRLGILTILDPKRYSYFGLQNLFLIKPNKNEIAITNMNEVEVSKELGSTLLLSTHGEKGMSLFKNGSYLHGLDAIKSKTVDVCGAGDITTAFLAASLVKYKDTKRAMSHATVAASMAVMKQGCYIIGRDIVDMILKEK